MQYGLNRLWCLFKTHKLLTTDQCHQQREAGEQTLLKVQLSKANAGETLTIHAQPPASRWSLLDLPSAR